MNWIKVTRRDGATEYVASTAAGVYQIDGNGYGRLRWSVVYPPNRYGRRDGGMTDTRREAEHWAELDCAERLRNGDIFRGSWSDVWSETM